MQFNVIMPFRPLTAGSCTCPDTAIKQLADGTWEAAEEHSFNKMYCASHRMDINQAIDTLNRYSTFKHKIIVVVDSDVFPNDNFLKEFDNVVVMKSPYVLDRDKDKYFYRMAAAIRDGFMVIPDEEWLCYIYLDDWICCKGWDRFIVEAIGKYGENYVYVPMFIEPYSHHYSQGGYFGDQEPTYERIWEKWRKEICCHSITMPIKGVGFIEEKEFEEYMRQAKRSDLIVEPCGVRGYGYYAGMIMKAKYAKTIGMKLGPGFDTDFDGRLYSILGLNKVVVTNSFILHTKYQKFKFNETI